jgi:hypothetical protein
VNAGQLPNLPDEMLLQMAQNLRNEAVKKPNMELNASMVLGFSECLEWVCAARKKLQDSGARLSNLSNLMADAAREAGGILVSRPGRSYVALSAVPSEETDENDNPTHITWVWIPEDDEPMVYLGDCLKDGAYELEVIGVTETSYIVSTYANEVQLLDKACVLQDVKNGKLEILNRAKAIESASQYVREAKAQAEAEARGDADEPLRGPGAGAQQEH